MFVNFDEIKKRWCWRLLLFDIYSGASIGHRFDRSIISMRLKRDEGGDVIFFLGCGDLEYKSDEHDCLHD